MLNARELDNLTEAWPDDQSDLGLQMFAARLRAGRPELSAPAIDRVEARLGQALDARMRKQARPMIRAARFADFRQRAIQVAPFAAAASLLLGVGVWMYEGGGIAADRKGPDAPAKLIKQTPPREDHLAPEGPSLPVP